MAENRKKSQTLSMTAYFFTASLLRGATPCSRRTLCARFSEQQTFAARGGPFPPRSCLAGAERSSVLFRDWKSADAQSFALGQPGQWGKTQSCALRQPWDNGAAPCRNVPGLEGTCGAEQKNSRLAVLGHPRVPLRGGRVAVRSVPAIEQTHTLAGTPAGLNRLTRHCARKARA
jgi:hypothetical protein